MERTADKAHRFAIGISQTRVAESLRRARDAPDHELCATYGALVSTLEQAFRDEEERIDEVDPGSAKAHRELSARVLHDLHLAHAQVMGGNLRLGRQIAGDLFPRWLGCRLAIVNVPTPMAEAVHSNARLSRSA